MDDFDVRMLKLEEFYEFYKAENIIDFIRKHEKLLDLLEISKYHLIDIFPTADFELEVFYDLEEGWDRLLVNIHADDTTFRNGIEDKLFKLNLELHPFQKKYNLIMEFSFIAGVRYVSTRGN